MVTPKLMIMRLNRILMKYVFGGLLMTSLLFTVELYAQVGEGKSVDVTLTVKDADGNVLPQATVVVGEGIIQTKTDDNGEFSFKAFPDDFVTISRPGFEKTVVLASELAADPVARDRYLSV